MACGSRIPSLCFYLVLFASSLISHAVAICVPRNATTLHASFLAPSSPAPAISPNTQSPLPATTVAPSAASNIDNICRLTDYRQLCSDILKLYQPNDPVDVRAVLDIHMKACSDFTNRALSTIAKLMSDPVTSHVTAVNLQVCRDNYQDALDNIHEASTSLATCDMGTFNSMMSAAMTDYATCDDTFMEVPGLSSPMAPLDDTLHKLASNSLALGASIN